MERLIKVGSMRVGSFNDISDVKGVRVGHFTKIDGDIRTGITAIIPHEDNLFTKKLMGASYVMNGFGKSLGLIQVNELAQIETPILLTNTLAVGSVANALVSYMVELNPKIGKEEATVNPLVLECNDGLLNNIQKNVLGLNEVKEAIKKATSPIIQGSIGAGAGMVCYGLKGGIGSSSRLFDIEGKTYTLGVLVNTNFGSTADLMVSGEYIGKKIMHKISSDEKGSIIVVIATDVGLSHRSMERVIKRASVGIARTGSIIGHGSGDIFLGFSTANPIIKTNKAFRTEEVLSEEYLNILFRAVVEASEEAIYHSMLYSKKTVGYRAEVSSLADFLKN